MEATDERMHFLDAGDFLRLPDRVDDADMAARGDDDEAAVLHVEAGRVLVGMLVRDDLALQLRRREMGVLGGVAAEPVLDPVSTMVLGKTSSMPERLICPVVKAWPATTVGARTEPSRPSGRPSARRSSVPKSVNWPATWVGLRRWQKLSSPPA